MGYALKIPFVKFGMDETDILNAGSLVMLEPGHPTLGWDGVPANGSTVPNIAADKAAGLGVVASNFPVVNTYAAGEALIERSEKGGFHAAENIGSLTQLHAFRVDNNTSFRSYIDAHTDHDFFMCTWMKYTRATGAGLSAFLHARLVSGSLTMIGLGASGSNGVYTGSPTSADSRQIGYDIETSEAGEYQAIAAHGVPEGWMAADQRLMNFGPYSSAQIGMTPGLLFYFSYLEDLTASGRTFEQANAVCKEYYQQQVLASGGRYNGDTYTAPA